MTISRNTKLKDLLDAFPWLVEEAIKLDSRAKILNNPIGKAFIRNATIEDLSKQTGKSVNEILDWLKELFEKKKAED